MAIKKSQLYSSIWKACDELRGSMDASQYKDYVLTMLFVRYVSDKYFGKKDSIVDVPKGGSFSDMVLLKGKINIGEGINTILSKLAESNELKGVIDIVDFNDETKLGKGKEMVDRLTKLISIFENSDLDFSKNKSDGDDLIGDAYEYLIGHFAVESGKSKGNFYTPAEVSRIIAKVIGADKSTKPTDTVYDPTCGSGSLLLKVADQAPNISIYGQEKDNTTKSLAILNMWMHGKSTADIKGDQSTLSNPLFLDSKTGGLKTFDYVVANPPFSLKSWTSGFVPSEDQFDRFDGYGMPPEKNGDYAFLLHILKSMKSRSGMGAVILPHGVLFRGNGEAEIRKNITKYITGIIGLPANLFYGTGIPACIIILDKSKADEHKGIFIIDASNEFIKDGNKNRLREQDIKKITDTFINRIETPYYSRFVQNAEIVKNDYNLNIPRYIEKENTDVIQNIDGHLNGGIPNADIDALYKFWEICPSLKNNMFKSKRAGFSELKINAAEINTMISSDKEFKRFNNYIFEKYNEFSSDINAILTNVKVGDKPKDIIANISNKLVSKFKDIKLIDKYDVYGILLNYWNDVMHDDLYLISTDGWTVGNSVIRGQKDGKKGKSDIPGLNGLEGAIIPVPLLINTYFSDDAERLEILRTELDGLESDIEQFFEENTGDDGIMNEVLNDSGNIDKKKLIAALKIAKGEEYEVFERYNILLNERMNIKKDIKNIEEVLECKVIKKYPELKTDEIKDIVINKKWMKNIENGISELNSKLSNGFTTKIKQIADRYQCTLNDVEKDVKDLELKVLQHLKKMGF